MNIECNTCGKSKPRDQFYETNTTYCIKCVKARSKADRDKYEDNDGLNHERPLDVYSIWDLRSGYVVVDVTDHESFDLEPYLEDHSYDEMLELMTWERIYQIVAWTDFGHFYTTSDLYTFLVTYFEDILNYYFASTEYERIHSVSREIYTALKHREIYGDIEINLTNANKRRSRPLLYYLDRDSYREFTA